MDFIVLLLLYPIVFLWGYYIGTPLLDQKMGVPFAINLFVGNIFSVALTGWLVPWAANKPLAWWLNPKSTASALTIHLAGATIILALFFAMVMVFWKLF